VSLEWQRDGVTRRPPPEATSGGAAIKEVGTMATLARHDPFTAHWPEWFGRRMDEWWPAWTLDVLGRTLRVEEFIEDGTLVVRAELPGVDPDKDVEITLHDRVLHIKGERSERSEDTQKASYRSEFHYGMFERRVPLPEGITAADVKATYRDGVLEIRVPVSTTTPPIEAVKIPISRIG
jgi:HSP20 family protein